MSGSSRAADALRELALVVSAETGEAFFRSLVEHLAAALRVRYVVVGRVLENPMNQVSTVSFWADGQFMDNITYDLTGTPCETIIAHQAQEVCVYAHDIQQKFPHDQMLAKLNVASYMGTPLVSANGHVMGLLMALDSTPITEDEAFARSLLQVFGVRAATEMDRYDAEQKLRAFSADLEQTVEQRTQELAAELEERHRAEIASRESEDKFRVVAEESPNMVFIMQHDRLVYANPACESIAGYTPAELTNSDFDPFSTVVEEYRERGREHIRRRLAREAVGPFEFSLQKRTGQELWVMLSSGLIQFAGEPAVLGILTDLTHKKEAEIKQKEFAQQLHHAEQMRLLGQLAGGVAHDFNNRITSIQGFAQLLSEEVGDDRLRDFAARIERSAKQAGKLTHQMLAYARKGDFESAPVNIHELIRDTVLLLEHSINKQILVEKELRATDESMVMGDASQLQGVLLDLAINARDAMPKGGRLLFQTRTIAAAALSEKNLLPDDAPRAEAYLVISVTDTGEGIPPETLTHIFEPFFTTKGSGMGTGMGLASALGIVQNHAGIIEVESSLNEGSVFRVYLPQLKSATKSIPPADRLPIKGAARILVVDDEEDMRELSSAALSALGYHVTLCEDGLQAVAHYQTHGDEIDLVILDMIMPNLDGSHTFRELMVINPQIKVLIATGYSHNNEVKKLLAGGARGVITKPFSISQFTEKITQALRPANAS